MLESLVIVFLLIEAMIYFVFLIIPISSYLQNTKYEGLTYFELMDRDMFIYKTFSPNKIYKELLNNKFKEYKFPFNKIFSFIYSGLKLNFLYVGIFASFRWIQWIFKKQSYFIENVKIKEEKPYEF